MALLTFVAFAVKGWKLAVGSLLGFLIIYGVGQWSNAMSSFALVLVASIIAIAIGIPLGILAAKSRTASAIVRPVLDFLQTMPAFVYLIPFVVLFRIGVVPGIVATILFSIAPAVRFTELGIKQVDREVVEAAHAFGAHPARILAQIQLPLARQNIMGGVNQVIMLALSMVVIAGMVGAGGLGADVYTSVTQVNISLGAESGLSVVILAMYLDRVTSAFGMSKRDQLTQ
ncbi:ABC transporter permease subunit [Flaviflexus sp. JY899]|uniref:ABC transporter permease subunit n=2 Tax=Flaviflexus equikiangi TaxID=2758573 RepID=A0ABS2TG64_9ACTO|nr:ABC transporter permease subunit [Flaviflexus equikiangi]